MSEGMIHRKVKEQIAQALQAMPGVTNVILEQHFGPVRADIGFSCSGKRGAVELQLSDKPLALIDERTRHYHELGIYVLWVLHDEEGTLCAGSRLVASDWEEYLHALYFGVVYHWAGGQELQPVYLVAVHNGEIVEQQSLPVIREMMDTTLRKYTAQLRADLRDDIRLDILEPMKTVSRNSDDRLASLIVRTVRDADIIRRLLYALVAKTFGLEFAQEAYENAKARSGQELAARTPAMKEAE